MSFGHRQETFDSFHSLHFRLEDKHTLVVQTPHSKSAHHIYIVKSPNTLNKSEDALQCRYLNNAVTSDKYFEMCPVL